MHGQEVAQHSDGQMQLGAFLASATIIAGSRSTFRRRTQGSTVDDGCTRQGAAPLGQTEQRAQIFRRYSEDR